MAKMFPGNSPSVPRIEIFPAIACFLLKARCIVPSSHIVAAAAPKIRCTCFVSCPCKPPLQQDRSTDSSTRAANRALRHIRAQHRLLYLHLHSIDCVDSEGRGKSPVADANLRRAVPKYPANLPAPVIRLQRQQGT